MQKKRDHSNLVAVRIPLELQSEIPKGNVSAYIKDAIREKIERDKSMKTCPTCKGMGKVRK